MFFWESDKIISISDIVEQLLNLDKIIYLPISKIVKDEELFKTYLNIVDYKTLLNIAENNDLSNIKVIRNLYNNTDINKDLNIDFDKYNDIQIEENINKIKKGKK